MIGKPITQLEQLNLNSNAKSFLKETAKWAYDKWYFFVINKRYQRNCLKGSINDILSLSKSFKYL